MSDQVDSGAAEPRASGVLTPWLSHLTRTAIGLGLGLGFGGQTLLWFHEGKFHPRTGLSAALVTGMIFGLVGVAAGLTTLPLARSRRWAPSVAAALLAGVSFLHLLSLWVRWLTGAFPSVAPFGMLLASPAQFLRAGLVGQRWRVAILAVASLVIWEVVRRRLRRPPAAPSDGRRLTVLCLGMVLTVGAVVATPAAIGSLGVLQVASPELRWMTTAMVRERSFDGHGMLSPPPGEPLAAGVRWTETIGELAGPRPNVLLMVLESVPVGHVGFGGYSRPVTPNLDRLASEGWLVGRAWSTATQSNYAQTSILSSLLPLRRRQLEMHFHLDYPRVLFHDIFNRLGYDTATISSQNENWQGLRRFQDTGTPTHYFHSLDHPGPHLGRGAERKIPDHLTADYVFGWLDRPREQPWALYVNFQRTHFPYELPRDLPRRYQPSEPTPRTFSFLAYPREELPIVVNRYDNALSYVDAQVGRLTDYLDRTGQLRSTLLIVVADHGELFGEKGGVTHAKSLLEPEVRVPLILHWPERLEPRLLETPVSTVDLLPTLLALLDLPPHPAFQGRSFADPGAHEAARPALYLTLQSLRSSYGVVCWPWKLIADWSTSEFSLFNLAEDPEENHDRYMPENQIAAALLDLLASQRQAQLDYYLGDSFRRGREYAPRLLTCPELPASTNQDHPTQASRSAARPIAAGGLGGQTTARPPA